MKKMIRNISAVVVCSLFFFSCNEPGKQLQSGFIAPPDTVQTSVYWYWISGNISKEGVVKDLQSMKAAGINRAFIGQIGLTPQETPTGPVRMFTDEWYDIVHTALKTATELGIDIGMFNCPGWSQAGGPWVKPEQAMRYLATTRTEVQGGQKVSITLPKPEGPFQDVKVLAYPAPAIDVPVLNTQTARILASSVPNASRMIDGNRETSVQFSRPGDAVIDILPHKPFTLRSVRIQTTEAPINNVVDLLVEENGDYRLLKSFVINRTNAGREVGFDPYAPVTITVFPTEGNRFRLVFKNTTAGSGIRELELSAVPLVERYSEKSLAKMHQTPLPYWQDYMWPAQEEPGDASLVVSADRVMDISDKLDGDLLTWEVPEGKWIVLRTGMLPTQVMNGPAIEDGIGLEVDKWSREHLAAHYDAYVGELCRRIPAEDRKAWKVIVSDSYEKGGQNFGDDFFEDFQQRYGYDPKPFLPVYSGVVVGSQEQSDRFLWDVRRMMADRLAYDHIGALRELAHKDGFTTWLENYGHWGFPGEFLQYGGQSDEVSGEFWSEGDLGNIENGAASSCAHIYGKSKVSAESFTCGGPPFIRYPALMKQRGDRFFSEGINNTLLHVYISQPTEGKKPGLNAWFGNEFNRNNTWFSQLDLFTLYLKRCNFMLQQGLNVADVAYFIGEDAPKMTGVTDPALPSGYQFDYINAEVITRDMTVKDGMLTLPHGTQYRVLVLPRQETMRPELLSKIKELVAEGAIVLGPAPNRSPSLQNYPEADQQVCRMAEELWGDAKSAKGKNSFGKGMVLNGYTMQEVFDMIQCIPDCKVGDKVPVLYGHRILNGMDIYFLTNQSDQTITFNPEFRVSGKQPEWWQPATGEVRNLSAYVQGKNTTIVPLKLEPFESAFIVFRSAADKSSLSSPEDNFPSPTVLAEVNNNWSVSFDSQMRGEPSVTFDVLKDWATVENENIKYYSGTAFYTNTFTLNNLPEQETLYVNLNRVGVMAKVKVNGTYVGGLWTAPYRLDITDFVKAGENQLEVEVVNTWVNRLIGDSRLPVDERPTWAPQNPFSPDTPLMPSGLIGPVVIESVAYSK